MPDLVHPRYPKLRLFKQPNGKSDNWYAWFHHEAKKYRKSMGTTILKDAEQLAEHWYMDTKTDLRRGTYKPPSTSAGPKFKSQIEPMLAGMDTRGRSARYVTTTRSLLAADAYIDRFWGKLPLSAITTSTWDDFREWLAEERTQEKKPRLSEGTVHQMKNAVSLVLKHAWVRQLVPSRIRFEDPYRQKRGDARPRTQFDDGERQRLLAALQEGEKKHASHGTRWREDAAELTDFVYFMLSTGMRVGEAQALRVCDVTVAEDDIVTNGQLGRAEVCHIRVVGGKRGAAPTCKSTIWAALAYKRLIKRRGITDPRHCHDKLFLRHHHEAFKTLLRAKGLYEDGYGRKRDFVSLRHTYICMRLEAGVPIFDVARNTRTSVTMIEQHYARAMPLAGAAINQTRFDDKPVRVRFNDAAT